MPLININQNQQQQNQLPNLPAQQPQVTVSKIAPDKKLQEPISLTELQNGVKEFNSQSPAPQVQPVLKPDISEELKTKLESLKNLLPSSNNSQLQNPEPEIKNLVPPPGIPPRLDNQPASNNTVVETNTN